MARKPEAPAPMPAHHTRKLGSFTQEEMEQIHGHMREALGYGEYIDWLNGQALFYTITAQRATDAEKAATKAAYYAGLLAKAIADGV